MRLRIALIGMSLLLCIAALSAQKSGDDLFQQGSALEAKGDTQGAIQTYKRIVQDFPSNRPLAAKATIHLAHLSDVLGQNAARSYYQSILDKYSDQTALAAEARKWIDSHTNTRIEIPTTFTNAPWSFAISHNGKSLVFQVTKGGSSSLCLLRRLDTDKQCTPIPGTESTHYSSSANGANPFWSHDDRFIGYFEDQRLKTISIDGGSPKTLASAPRNGGGTWNAAGDIVFTPEIYGPLLRVSAKGEEEAVQLTELDSTTWAHRYPSFLPDGRHFLMYRRMKDSETGLVTIGSLDGDEMKTLLGASAAAFAPPHHVVFASGGALYSQELDPRTMALSGSRVILEDRVAVFVGFTGFAAFSVSDAGPVAYRKSIAARRRVLWRDALGKETSILNLALTTYLTGTPRFSSNGHDVSFARNDGALFINVLNTNTEQTQIHMNVGGGLLSNESPIWSPDGKSLVFAAVGSESFPGVSQLVQVGASSDSLRHELIWKSGENKVPTDWNGEFLLFNRTSATTKRDVMVMSVTRGSEPTPIASTDAQESNGRFSRDGKWIVYESDEFDKRPEIFVQPFPGTRSDRLRVSNSGGTMPQWSWDGTSIYFLSPSPDSHLMAAGFTTSADSRVPAIGKPVALFSVREDSTYAPAPDGRFLISEPTEELPPIIVIQNPFGVTR